MNSKHTQYTWDVRPPSPIKKILIRRMKTFVLQDGPTLGNNDENTQSVKSFPCRAYFATPKNIKRKKKKPIKNLPIDFISTVHSPKSPKLTPRPKKITRWKLFKTIQDTETPKHGMGQVLLADVALQRSKLPTIEKQMQNKNWLSTPKLSIDSTKHRRLQTFQFPKKNPHSPQGSGSTSISGSKSLRFLNKKKRLNIV